MLWSSQFVKVFSNQGLLKTIFKIEPSENESLYNPVAYSVLCN